MPSLKRITLSVLVVAVLAAALLNVLVWQGYFVDDDGSAAPARRTATQDQPEPAPPPPPAITRTAPVAPPPAPSVSTIVLSASRGDCWVLARDGSSTGPILYEGLLQQGASRRLKAKRLWLSLGAAANVDLLIDGKPEELPGGTVEVLVPSQSNS